MSISQTLAAKQAELVKALFESVPAFPLSHACIVTDLTPILTIDRRVGWTYPPALPKWEGGLSVDGFVDLSRQFLFQEAWASPPWGTSYPKPFDKLRINSASGGRESGFVASSPLRHGFASQCGV